MSHHQPSPLCSLSIVVSRGSTCSWAHRVVQWRCGGVACVACGCGCNTGWVVVGVVGVAHFGLMSACEQGVALQRMVLVTPTANKREWASTVAAVADGFELIMLQVPHGVGVADAQRSGPHSISSQCSGACRHRSKIGTAICISTRRCAAYQYNKVVRHRARRRVRTEPRNFCCGKW